MTKHVRVEEVARQLCCCPETVRRMLRNREIPGLKIAGKWLVNPDLVEEALRKSCQENSSHCLSESS